LTLKESLMKNMITKILLVAAMVACVASTVNAQQSISPEKRALIKELLEATGQPKTSEDTIAAMMKQYEVELPKLLAMMIKDDRQLNDAYKEQMLTDMTKDVPRMLKRYSDLITQRMNISQFIEAAIYPLYDKYFTENEIRDMIAFYKTETGKKTVTVMPAVYAESISKSMDYFMPIMKQIKEEINKDIEQYVNEKKNSSKKKPLKS
ncbi:MAG TPA: DUF2059 domain-containing protein, partial [Pyrinomonadaceae bacterium]|nr:DUF2059 domain-containing protein [Pyrinomonadaceae bacterium]